MVSPVSMPFAGNFHVIEFPSQTHFCLWMLSIRAAVESRPKPRTERRFARLCLKSAMTHTSSGGGSARSTLVFLVVALYLNGYLFLCRRKIQRCRQPS